MPVNYASLKQISRLNQQLNISLNIVSSGINHLIFEDSKSKYTNINKLEVLYFDINVLQSKFFYIKDEIITIPSNIITLDEIDIYLKIKTKCIVDFTDEFLSESIKEIVFIINSTLIHNIDNINNIDKKNYLAHLLILPLSFLPNDYSSIIIKLKNFIAQPVSYLPESYNSNFTILKYIIEQPENTVYKPEVLLVGSQVLYILLLTLCGNKERYKKIQSVMKNTDCDIKITVSLISSSKLEQQIEFDYLHEELLNLANAAGIEINKPPVLVNNNRTKFYSIGNPQMDLVLTCEKYTHFSNSNIALTLSDGSCSSWTNGQLIIKDALALENIINSNLEIYNLQSYITPTVNLNALAYAHKLIHKLRRIDFSLIEQQRNNLHYITENDKVLELSQSKYGVNTINQETSTVTTINSNDLEPIKDCYVQEKTSPNEEHNPHKRQETIQEPHSSVSEKQEPNIDQTANNDISTQEQRKTKALAKKEIKSQKKIKQQKEKEGGLEQDKSREVKEHTDKAKKENKQDEKQKTRQSIIDQEIAKIEVEIQNKAEKKQRANKRKTLQGTKASVTNRNSIFIVADDYIDIARGTDAKGTVKTMGDITTNIKKLFADTIESNKRNIVSHDKKTTYNENDNDFLPEQYKNKANTNPSHRSKESRKKGNYSSRCKNNQATAADPLLKYLNEVNSLFFHLSTIKLPDLLNTDLRILREDIKLINDNNNVLTHGYIGLITNRKYHSLLLAIKISAEVSSCRFISSNNPALCLISLSRTLQTYNVLKKLTQSGYDPVISTSIMKYVNSDIFKIHVNNYDIEQYIVAMINVIKLYYTNTNPEINSFINDIYIIVSSKTASSLFINEYFNFINCYVEYITAYNSSKKDSDINTQITERKSSYFNVVSKSMLNALLDGGKILTSDIKELDDLLIEILTLKYANKPEIEFKSTVFINTVEQYIKLISNINNNTTDKYTIRPEVTNAISLFIANNCILLSKLVHLSPATGNNSNDTIAILQPIMRKLLDLDEAEHDILQANNCISKLYDRFMIYSYYLTVNCQDPSVVNELKIRITDDFMCYLVNVLAKRFNHAIESRNTSNNTCLIGEVNHILVLLTHDIENGIKEKLIEIVQDNLPDDSNYTAKPEVYNIISCTINNILSKLQLTSVISQPSGNNTAGNTACNLLTVLHNSFQNTDNDTPKTICNALVDIDTIKYHGPVR